MPSIIKVKRSSTAGVVPASLSAGELAANTADSLIYVGTGSGVTAIRPRVSATDRVLGRSSAGAGPAEELVCTAQGRSIISAVDAAAQRSVLALGAMATSSGVTLTGDVTGSGTGSFAATLSNSGVSAGTYRSVTVDAKGRVTAGSNPTTLAGYGITDAVTAGGSGASGTWAISITGSAAQLGGVAAANYFRVDGTYANADMNVPVEGYWHVASNAANLPDGALYGHRWDYDHAGDGNWVAQFYTPTSGDAGMWFRQRRGGTWQTWRKLIDSTTYNSYSPTLTGGGASGTWGINVSGELTGTQVGLGYTLSTATVAYAGQAGPQIRSQGGGAACMSFHRPNAYAVNFGLDTDNQLKVGGWSLGANSYVILSSNNYNSYSPTLTGGGASGTWGINVTGTAASETLATVTGRGASTSTNITTTGAMYASNWFRSNGSTGWYNEAWGGGIWMADATYVRVYGGKQFYADAAISSGTAMYAPIYYDNNDATFWVDPANAGFYLRGGTSNRVIYQTHDVGILVSNPEGAGGQIRLGSAWGRIGIYNNPNIMIGSESQIDLVIGNNVRWSLASDGAVTSVGVPAYFVRAFVNFNAATTPALQGAGNVSSVTYRNGVGLYTVNFTTAIPRPGGGTNRPSYFGSVGNGTDSFLNTTMRFAGKFFSASGMTSIDIAIVTSGGQGVPAASNAMTDCTFMVVST